VLHEALTGRPPYAAASPVALAGEQRAGPPNLDGIDPALTALLASSLAYDPADRPLHAGAMASALRDWLSGDPSAALAMAPVPGVGPIDTAAVTQPIAVVAPPAPPAAPPGAVSGSRSRRPLILIGALAALLLLVGAAVVANGLGPGDDGIGGASSPSASANSTPIETPPPTPAPPEWLAGLVEKVAKNCGAELVAEAEAEMAVMTEDEAKDYAAEETRACKKAADDDEGDGGGNGRGGGNGNGNGGNDDD
jgi:hypothetical protein